MIYYENLELYLRLRLKPKKNTSQISVVKAICWFQFTEQNRSRNNGDKDGKALYKLLNKAVKLVSNKKDYLKWKSKPSYMPHKIFKNDLVAIRKNKVTLTYSKHAYIGICILELSNVLMYEFHSDYTKLKINIGKTQNSYSQTLIV